MTGELMIGSGLQGLWHLNGNWNDSSPNGYTLTPAAAGAAPTSVVSKFGLGYSFVAASSQKATIADASCPNLEISGSQTWLCWIKSTTLSNYQSPMGKVTTENDTDHSFIVDSSGAVYFRLKGLTTNTQVISDAVVSVGQWALLVGVYDSSASLLKLWINGVKKQVTASGSAIDTNGVFALGVNGAGTFYYNGLIDEAAIYNRAWSDAEVVNYRAWALGRRTYLI